MANFTKKAIKYVLAEEMFSDYLVEADANYHKLQKENNPINSAVQGYVNLLEAILQLFYENYRFFSHTTTHENPYLYSLFFNKALVSVDDYLGRHRGVVSRFPQKQTAALLCNSLFGVINTCIADEMQENEVRQMAHEIYQRLLRSELFITVEKKAS